MKDYFAISLIACCLFALVYLSFKNGEMNKERTEQDENAPIKRALSRSFDDMVRDLEESNGGKHLLRDHVYNLKVNGTWYEIVIIMEKHLED